MIFESNFDKFLLKIFPLILALNIHTLFTFYYTLVTCIEFYIILNLKLINVKQKEKFYYTFFFLKNSKKIKNKKKKAIDAKA